MKKSEWREHSRWLMEKLRERTQALTICQDALAKERRLAAENETVELRKARIEIDVLRAQVTELEAQWDGSIDELTRNPGYDRNDARALMTVAWPPPNPANRHCRYGALRCNGAHHNEIEPVG